MPRRFCSYPALILLLLQAGRVVAQYDSPLPYNPRLLNDASVGNVQGTQRFGRQLKTDPDVGVGYSYQVFPRWILGTGGVDIQGVGVQGGGAQGVGGSNADVVVDALNKLCDDLSANWEKFKTKPGDPELKKGIKDALTRFRTYVEKLQSQQATENTELSELENRSNSLNVGINAVGSLEEADNFNGTWTKNIKEIRQHIANLRQTSFATLLSGSMPGAPFAQAYSQPLQDSYWEPTGDPFSQDFFCATDGMRNLSPDPLMPFGPALPGYQPFAQVVNWKLNAKTKQYEVETMPLYHQPLIQIKVRVIEVGRASDLEVASVLDYIGASNANDTLFTGGNINNNGRKTSGVTRFPASIGIAPGTIFPAGIAAVKGSGALINLTTERINLLTSLLAADFNADVITAPEVVTLNGQNVEFVSGQKLPFALGLDIVSGASRTSTNFFYKSVGTYVSVTPRIVNWGKHAEMHGRTPIVATEVADWNALVRWMCVPGNLIFVADKDGNDPDEPAYKALSVSRLQPYANPNVPVPYEMRRDILRELSKYPGDELRARLGPLKVDAPMSGVKQVVFEDLPPPQSPTPTPAADSPPQSPLLETLPEPAALEPILRVPTGVCCDWRPEECTIDLEIVVRLSKAIPSTLTLNVPRSDSNNNDTITKTDVDVNTETGVCAVSNVLQVQSGHGVGMAGLIGDSDTEVVAKVPILGDAPLVGYLFRSKTTTREKKETLIFVEARVLPDPDQVLCQSAQDFGLGKAYVQGDFLDNPLERGSYRAGFGTYLPPVCHDEAIFWERCSRRVRKVCTEANDALE